MYCYGWEKTDAGHSWNSLKGLKLELQDHIMERLFVILTFECVMCFHSNTGDKICEVLCDKVFQRGDLYGLENICEVLCCNGQFQDHKGCPGGVLPYKRLIGMCRWMGSHFHDWSDYNGVAFSIELVEWGRKFSDFGGE